MKKTWRQAIVVEDKTIEALERLWVCYDEWNNVYVRDINYAPPIIVWIFIWLVCAVLATAIFAIENWPICIW